MFTVFLQCQNLRHIFISAIRVLCPPSMHVHPPFVVFTRIWVYRILCTANLHVCHSRPISWSPLLHMHRMFSCRGDHTLRRLHTYLTASSSQKNLCTATTSQMYISITLKAYEIIHTRGSSWVNELTPWRCYLLWEGTACMSWCTRLCNFQLDCGVRTIG